MHVRIVLSCHSSFEEFPQHLFQVPGSEFQGGNFVILYVLCIPRNDFSVIALRSVFLSSGSGTFHNFWVL
jgi:hypothetical protein